MNVPSMELKQKALKNILNLQKYIYIIVTKIIIQEITIMKIEIKLFIIV